MNLKTTHLLLILSLLALSKIQAQKPITLQGYDTTLVKYVDTIKGYTFENVYIIVTSLNIQRGTTNTFMTSMPAPASITMNSTPTKAKQDSLLAEATNWKGNARISIYTSRKNYENGKQPIDNISVSVDLSDKLNLSSKEVMAIIIKRLSQ